jgi:hypothetical protein
MKRMIGCIALAALLGVSMICLSGCSKKQEPKGAMEKAGAKMDDAAKKGADKAGDATKKMDEAAKKGG